MATNNRRNNIPQRSNDAFSVENVRVFDNGDTLFTLVYMGKCTIYNCRIVVGKHGEFIGFPSRKVEPKRRGESVRYFNIAWMALTEAEQSEIIALVYAALEDQHA